MDLVLDPNDGRGTGLRLKRIERQPVPPEVESPYASMLNDTIRDTFVALMDEVCARAATTWAMGYQIEDLDIQSSGEWGPDGGPILKMSARYHAVQPATIPP